MGGQRHPRLGRPHLPPEVAANSGQIAVIAARTTPVGATSLLQIATSAPEPSMPAPLRHRAMVMRQHQCRLLQHHQRRPNRLRQLQEQGSVAGALARVAQTRMIGATRMPRIATRALGNGVLCRRVFIGPALPLPYWHTGRVRCMFWLSIRVVQRVVRCEQGHLDPWLAHPQDSNLLYTCTCTCTHCPFDA